MKSNRKAAFSVRQRGFTMAEMLVVMAVIMVLSGIAAPNATRILNNVRQMSLNRSAETIYMTAQRNLIAAKVAGKDFPSSPIASSANHKVTSDDKRTKPSIASDPASAPIFDPDAAVNIVLPANTISPSLCAGNWTIEYDAYSLVVKVYYSENTPVGILDTVYAGGKLGKVGYYGQ